jgi:hypothetical protein
VRAAFDDHPSIHHQDQIRREVSFLELLNQLIIIRMRANPIPDDVIPFADTDGAIIQTNAD